MHSTFNRVFARVAGLTLVLLTFANPALPATADNLPVYTSPLDLTGLKVELHLAAPDRETGKRVDVALPVGLIGPKMTQMFSTPLSTQLDQYWSSRIDPKTGMTARAAACDGKDGIKQQVVAQIAKLGSHYSAYDVACNLATTGHLLARQSGSTLTLAYQLTNNMVSFASTSPDTCRAGHGTFACPNDPRFTVHFATQLVTSMRTPGLCQLTAENGTVFVNGVSIDANNGAAAVAKFFGGQKFLAAELAISNVMRTQPLPIDAALAEVRTSRPCNGSIPGMSRLLSAFSDLQTEIDMRRGIIIRATHVGIVTPTLDAPNPGGARGAQAPSVPSFTRPTISTSQPIVPAGSTVQTIGQYFPPNLNFATALPVTLQHGAYGPNSQMLDAGVCLGGVTEIKWGPVGGALRVLRFPGDSRGVCTPSYAAVNLTPNTAYQFSARDCDPITCSPWSTPLKSTTAKIDTGRGKVLLTLDGGTPLGTTLAGAKGTFAAAVAIPAGTARGPHTIHAVDGDARADVAIQVTPPLSAGRTRASIMMVGVLKGEAGCPNHPIASTQTDDTFMLFGSGLTPGAVSVHLDSPTGMSLGTATVRADGTMCQQMRSPSASSAGAHTLVAVQNGAATAQYPVTFVTPSFVR